MKLLHIHKFTGRITETADRCIQQRPNHEKNISEHKEASSFESREKSQESCLSSGLYLYSKSQS